MTRNVLLMLGALAMPECYWHESADEDAEPSCGTVPWAEARVHIDQVIAQEAGWGKACVPLLAGDEFIVRRAPSCIRGIFSGDPTPEFIAPYAPYCTLESGPGFVCRMQELTDGQSYTGLEVVVEFVGGTLIVDWHQPATDEAPERTCKQQYQVTFIATGTDP